MHKVAVLALPGVIAFELGIGCEVFGNAVTKNGDPAYDVFVCGEHDVVNTPLFDIRVSCHLDRLRTADTILIPGVIDPDAAVSLAIIRAIQFAWDRGARLASICTGAFVLAKTGLLDGRCATTHWQAVDRFARAFPAVDLSPEALYVDEGRIITSAGGAAGLDMCLHLIGRDQGLSEAVKAAQVMVAPLHRDGGQAQFIRRELPVAQCSLAPVLEWLGANLDQRLTVDEMAHRANMSPRTFARRFRERTGTTPFQWLTAARIRLAQEMLESSDMRIEQIATASGFDSPGNFRARFQRSMGLSPVAYRHRFRIPDRNAALARAVS